MNKKQHGFGLLAVLVLAVVLVAACLAGWLVWQRSVPQSENAHATTTQQKSGAIVLKYSRLSFVPAKGQWVNVDNESHILDGCGKQDSLTLSKTNTTFMLRATLGECGKGGTPCTADIPCTTQEERLATVKLSNNETGYIIVKRSNTNNGRGWTYGVWLSSTPVCTDSTLCSFWAPGITNPGVVFGMYDDVSKTKANPSLADYVKLPEVKAAITLLETAKYQ